MKFKKLGTHTYTVYYVYNTVSWVSPYLDTGTLAKTAIKIRSICLSTNTDIYLFIYTHTHKHFHFNSLKVICKYLQLVI